MCYSISCKQYLINYRSVVLYRISCTHNYWSVVCVCHKSVVYIIRSVVQTIIDHYRSVVRVIESVVNIIRSVVRTIIYQLCVLENQLYPQLLISCVCHKISCKYFTISCTHNYRSLSISCACHRISCKYYPISCAHNCRSVVRVIRSVVRTIIDQLCGLSDQLYTQLSISCPGYSISCTHNCRSVVNILRSVVCTIIDRLCVLFDQL